MQLPGDLHLMTCILVKPSWSKQLYLLSSLVQEGLFLPNMQRIDVMIWQAMLLISFFLTYAYVN